MTQVLKKLKRLRRRVVWTHGLLVTDGGICTFLTLPECKKIRRHFESWPKYSGVIGYPVPGVKGIAAIPMYDYNHKWNQFTEYGRLRLELLNHVIAELEKQQCDFCGKTIGHCGQC